jgi:ABC-type lipoprotein export system ATPase subunit
MALAELRDVRRSYRLGDEDVHALAGVTLDLEHGDFAAIIGSSGSGKSTLMHVLGFMDRPTSGAMRFDGEDVTTINETRRAAIRSEKIGFVFQAFNLLPRLNVADNVRLPLTYARTRIADARERVAESLERVGMGHRARHRPAQLSGGERQRVAIARALVNRPRLLLADEPTGNLDSANVERVLGLFGELHGAGQTIVLVTHDPAVAARAHRQIRIRDGRIIEDVRR